MPQIHDAFLHVQIGYVSGMLSGTSTYGEGGRLVPDSDWDWTKYIGLEVGDGRVQATSLQ